MLARAIAKESGANFLNVQSSSVSSMFVGESEKLVSALFSLARKLKPCVIFIDEIDSMLKLRHQSSPHYVQNTINEFMLSWDGIMAESSNGVVVIGNLFILILGATNRPYDLDEACLRRLPKRLLVDLPNEDGRREILSILLKDEVVENLENVLDFVVENTRNFSGSDLKNLCIAAAFNAIREMQEVSANRVIMMKHFELAFKNGDVVSSQSSENRRLLMDWNAKFGTSHSSSKAFSAWGF